MDNRNRNILFGLFAAVFALAVAGVVVFLMIGSNEASSRYSASERLETYMLADELRQSSDDLTRMARQYAATGDARYKGYFETILDIRNGAAPRPERYGGVYWDLVADTGQPPREAGESVSLLDLATASGYTGAETALFLEAEDNSDALAELEEEAMAAVAAGDLARATDLLNNAEYNRRKAEVMRPIDRLLVSLDDKYSRAADDGASARGALIPIMLAALGLTALVSVGAIAWTAMAFRRS